MKKIDSIIEEYVNVIKSTKNLSKKTIIAYRSDLLDFVNTIGNEKISDNTIINYVQELSQTRKLKDTTINRRLIVLRMFFNYAYSQNYFDKNYFYSILLSLRRKNHYPKLWKLKKLQNF